MKHAGERHIVDVRPVPKRELASLVSRQARSDLSCVAISVQRDLAAQSFAGELDRIHDLYITGATAMMHGEDAIDLVVRRIRTLVDKVLGAGDDSRCAEAALQTGRFN